MTIELDVTEERIDSPNVVGLVRGKDPVLKNTYIVVGAHLDHLGTFVGYFVTLKLAPFPTISIFPMSILITRSAISK
jgi:hypothetical protein